MQDNRQSTAIRVIYSDSDILVVSKPAGVPTQADKSGSDDLLKLLSRQLGIDMAGLFPVHRLDRPVSGLQIIALNASSQRHLTINIQKRAITKSYMAVVCGTPESQGVLEHMLVRDGRLNVSRVSPASPRAKKARLAYKVLHSVIDDCDGPISLIGIKLETGRHHQIRVQMAHAGWPIWGDTKYNPDFKHRGGWHRIALVACSLAFYHPVDGRRMTFELPLPDQVPFNCFNR